MEGTENEEVGETQRDAAMKRGDYQQPLGAGTLEEAASTGVPSSGLHA